MNEQSDKGTRYHGNNYELTTSHIMLRAMLEKTPAIEAGQISANLGSVLLCKVSTNPSRAGISTKFGQFGLINPRRGLGCRQGLKLRSQLSGRSLDFSLRNFCG
jgi:hypothetical protein